MPWVSARTWISMCLGRVMYRSISSVSSPNAARASRRAAASAAGSSLGGADHAHALAAPSGGGFDEEGKHGPVQTDNELFIGHAGLSCARYHRNAGRGHRRLRGDLVAHRLDRGGRRADEHQAGGGAGAGEGGVLREEAVAGMHGFRPGRARGGDDRVDVQVALRGGGRADPHRLAGRADVRGAGVGVAVDRDAGDAEPVEGGDDPDGDLAAVGDQDLTEGLSRHGHLTSGRRRSRPARAGRWRPRTARARGPGGSRPGR